MEFDTNWPFSLTVSDNDRSDDVTRPADKKASAANDDFELLDAYSRAVMSVVQTVSPAVISVAGASNEGRNGQGSGFIITPDGFAVTNSHVVDGRGKLSALTNEGDRLDCVVIGDDPSTDIAILRLAGSDLPHVQVGDSNKLQVGQLVIAMGSPLGLHSTVSTGVVSSVGRSMRAGDGRLIDNVIQHAAPINPGNSGGPLVDTRGRVVGVNTAIIAFAQGIGFAVPSNTVQWVTSEFLTHRRVRRRQLGIMGTVVQLARSVVLDLDLISDTAVQIMDVDTKGIGFKHGLRQGDIIISVNDRVVANIDDLQRFLSKSPVDAVLELSIIRDNTLHRIELARSE